MSMTTITVVGREGADIRPGDVLTVGRGVGMEYMRVISVNGTSLTVRPTLRTRVKRWLRDLPRRARLVRERLRDTVAVLVGKAEADYPEDWRRPEWD